MNFRALNLFLSDDNIRRHLDHHNCIKLKLSILEKSLPTIKGKDVDEIMRMRLDKDVKKEAIGLLCYIKSHQDFFDSFTEHQNIQTHGGISREKLLYDIYTEAMAREYGFLFVYNDTHGRIKTAFSFDGRDIYPTVKPVLALDLYEHTYFLDYGFKKDKFLKNALGYLDISRLYGDT